MAHTMRTIYTRLISVYTCGTECIQIAHYSIDGFLFSFLIQVLALYPTLHRALQFPPKCHLLWRQAILQNTVYISLVRWHVDGDAHKIDTEWLSLYLVSAPTHIILMGIRCMCTLCLRKIYTIQLNQAQLQPTRDRFGNKISRGFFHIYDVYSHSHSQIDGYPFPLEILSLFAFENTHTHTKYSPYKLQIYWFSVAGTL